MRPGLLPRAVLAVGVLAGVASACGGDDAPEAQSAPSVPARAAAADTAPRGELDQAVLDAAKAEGKLVYYASQTEEITNALAEAFEERYGIQVEHQRLTSSNLIQRFSSEQTAGIHAVDGMHVATLQMYEEHPEWFLPVDETVLPRLADYPADAVGPHYFKTYSLGFGLTYNTDLVAAEDAPDSWEDVLDPKFKGRIVLSDLRSTPTWMQWAELMRRHFGDDFLIRLRDQGFDLADSASPGAQKVAAGAYALSFPATASHSAELRSQGAPLEFVTPGDATMAAILYEAIAENAPHPNAARVYANWLMSPEAQEIACSAAEITATLPDIPGCVPLPPITDPSVVEIDADTDAQGVLLDALGIPR